MVLKKVCVLLLLVSSLILSMFYTSAVSQTYDVGEMYSDFSVYSCWPSCIAYINLTVNSSSPLANENWSISLNNTANYSSINYGIEWMNESNSWASQSANNTFINNSNLNLTNTTHQFRINITLPYALSTLWNVSLNINGTDYNLSVYLDSISLNSPVNYNTTEDQTPSFNFTFLSNNWTSQSCTLYTRLNDAGAWTSQATNSSVLNGSYAVLTAGTLSEGNYTWNISCNSTGSSATRWIYIDDETNPEITVGPEEEETSTSVEITWTTNEATNYTIEYGSDPEDLDEDEVADSDPDPDDYDTDHYIEITGLSSDTTYDYNITFCDSHNNCKVENDHFNTLEADDDEGDEGSGTGATAAVDPLSKTWTTIAQNSPQVWVVNNALVGIKQINLTVNNSTRNVNITISKYTSKPSGVSAEKSNTYKYFGIKAINLAQNLSQAVLTLYVNKTWVDSRGLKKENVSLFKFNNVTSEWDEIATTYASNDSTYYYYTSTLNSFSYFAIAGKTAAAAASSSSQVNSSVQNATNQTAGAGIGNITEEADGEGDESGKEGYSKWIILTSVIVLGLLALAVAGYIIYRQFFKKKYK
jgi:PGF-pre-PGF domain-containing protein